jgi:cytochrome P450
MSESIYLVHTNADIFPEPREFIPERWLEADAPTKYLVPFSKGARHCLGMNLAIAELYLTVVRIFRTLDLELFETTTRDVEIFHEYIVGRGPADSKGIRAKVVGAVLR